MFNETNLYIYNFSIFLLSAPVEYDFYFYQKVFVLGTHQVGIQRSMSEIVGIRFKENFTTILPTDALIAELEQIVLHDIAEDYQNILISMSRIIEGLYINH